MSSYLTTLAKRGCATHSALTRYLRQQPLWCKHPRPSFPFFCKRRRKSVFFAFASGEPRISHLAAVKSGRRPSRSDEKLKLSALYRHSERGITNLWICERSELRIKNYDLRAKRVRMKIVLKSFLFSEFIHRKKWFKNSFF